MVKFGRYIYLVLVVIYLIDSHKSNKQQSNGLLFDRVYIVVHRDQIKFVSEDRKIMNLIDKIDS